MSLIRQIWLLLLATVLLAFAGGVGVSIDAARDTLQTQLRLKNSDNATALALVLSQQRGDSAAMQLVLSAQFDTGYFERIAFVPADGAAPVVREARAAPLEAPAWFVRALPIESATGVAQVSDGWRALGAVQVTSHSAYAHDELWRGSVRSALGLALVGMLAALAALLMLARIRRPLDAAVEQARALERGEYVRVAEPRIPELRRLTAAMNSMVARLRLVFEGQAQQVEALRRQVNCDPLTGLANRTHFLAQFDAGLQAEEHQGARGLILLRVVQLADLNRSMGRAATDRMLRTIAEVLQEYARRLPGCLAGRLNGSDFAVALPAAGVAAETATTLVGTLRAALPALGAQAAVVAGAIEVGAGASLSDALATADLALARAEGIGAFTVESADTPMFSENLVPVTSVEDARKVLRIMEAMEDNDDVQDVYSNFDIADDVMEAAAG